MSIKPLNERLDELAGQGEVQPKPVVEMPPKGAGINLQDVQPLDFEPSDIDESQSIQVAGKFTPFEGIAKMFSKETKGLANKGKDAVDEVVPLGNKVVDRASAGHAGEKFSGVAKWNAAIHAASALDFEFFLGHVLVELVPIFDAAARRDVRGDLAVVFDKSSWFSHGLVPP